MNNCKNCKKEITDAKRSSKKFCCQDCRYKYHSDKEIRERALKFIQMMLDNNKTLEDAKLFLTDKENTLLI